MAQLASAAAVPLHQTATQQQASSNCCSPNHDTTAESVTLPRKPSQSKNLANQHNTNARVHNKRMAHF
jgi:hypothetical protein